MGAAEDVARRHEVPDPEPIMVGLAARRPPADDAAGVSAWMLGVLGVLHAPVYRARELRTRLAEGGIDTAMGAYLAQRSAPLGAPGPELISAVFYGFSPAAVAEHIPAVWEHIEPRRVLELTLEAMRELLGRLLAGRESQVAELARLLGPVAASHPTAGRPLAAAWASVPLTGEPLLDMWLATCVIRESRGDAHVALLVTEDIGPLESHLITQGNRAELRPMLASMRGWTASDIEAAALRLQERGLLDVGGLRTDAARSLRSDIERRTDALSSAPWAAAGEAAVTRIGDLALQLLPPVITSGTLLPPVLARLGLRS